MSIKFVCSCGKRLKARDDMAAKRTVCPRCGNPVGIPSLDPNVPTPMTPAERLRAQARRSARYLDVEESPAPQIAPVPQGEEPTEKLRAEQSDSVPATQYPVPSTQYSVLRTHHPTSTPTSQAVPAPRPLDPTAARLRRVRRHQRRYASRYEWRLETSWYECLAYPFRAWPLVLVLAAVITLLTAAAALGLPRLLAEVPLNATSIPYIVVSILPLVLLAGYVCGFLDCVLAGGMAGESRFVHWPGRDLGLIVRSLGAWLVAFASAPAPLAVLGFYYWLYTGDLQV